MIVRTSMLVLALAWPAAAPALADEAGIVVAIVPGGPVFAEETGGTFDLMVQNLVVANRGAETVEVTGLRLELLRDGETGASYVIPAAAVVADTAELAGMAAQELAGLVGAQLLDPAAARAGDAFSTDARLERGERLVSTGTYLAAAGTPDRLRIQVSYRRASGGIAVATAASAVAVRPARLGYRLPLRGVWNMRGLPGARSHHRRIPPNEFALDFFRLGADGALSSGDSLVAGNSFGYGAPVLAAADGEVVAVTSGVTQDRSVFSVRAGETRETAGRRIRQHNMQRMSADFRRALAGNLVTIRHEFADGRVEYSSYGHLAAGSIRVAPGDRVAQGSVIGAVGDTGDSSAVHLHFQLNAGPDPFFTRSLPARFDDLRETFGGQDAGIFVTSDAPAQ